MAEFVAGGFDGGLDYPDRVLAGLPGPGELTSLGGFAEESKLLGYLSESAGGFAEVADGFGVRHGGADRVAGRGLLGGAGGELVSQFPDEGAEFGNLSADLDGIGNPGRSGGGKQRFLLPQGARPGAQGDRLLEG
ncbi:hypothetical protein [Streptomyces sp. LS1784]|uniref:hypothetical protein n=1 Tax=Streptomyces sp. LS1784 TaxID=2851533 RepID=UPI001CCE9722|nr:hypothetical protein [Streptomyces sp. LS1784]